MSGVAQGSDSWVASREVDKVVIVDCCGSGERQASSLVQRGGIANVQPCVPVSVHIDGAVGCRACSFIIDVTDGYGSCGIVSSCIAVELAFLALQPAVGLIAEGEIYVGTLFQVGIA